MLHNKLTEKRELCRGRAQNFHGFALVFMTEKYIRAHVEGAPSQRVATKGLIVEQRDARLGSAGGHGSVSSATEKRFCCFFFFFLKIFYFIHMCIQCLGHFSPLPPAPTLTPLPYLPLPLTTQQKLFCPYL
jgi:hypothetical protein